MFVTAEVLACTEYFYFLSGLPLFYGCGWLKGVCGVNRVQFFVGIMFVVMFKDAYISTKYMCLPCLRTSPAEEIEYQLTYAQTQMRTRTYIYTDMNLWLKVGRNFFRRPNNGLISYILHK